MMAFLRRLRARLKYRKFDADVRDELAAHRAMAEDEARARGESADEARYEAARRLGNGTLAREEARAVWIAPWLESVWQDARYAVRSLWANPGFSLPALAILIVTMGLTTGVYSMAQALLLQPWPVPEADRVTSVIPVQPVNNGWFYSTSYLAYRQLRDQATSIDLAAMTTTSLRLGERPEEEPLPARLVSGNYFDVLRIPVVAGRALLPIDDTPTGAAVAVISHALAQRQFGGAQNAVGSLLRVNDVAFTSFGPERVADDVAFTVIGVAAPGAKDDPRRVPPAVWLPLQVKSGLAPGDERVRRFFEEPGAWELDQLVGRLRPGFTRRMADAEIKSLMTRFATIHNLAPAEVSVTGTEWIHHPAAQQARQVYGLLSAAAILTLLLGCANVGNLQLARGVSRGAEFGVRRSLGAPRGRLIRQLLTEGLVLAALGAVVSVMLVWQALPRVLPAFQFLRPEFLAINGRVLLFVLGLMLSVTLLSGVLPALRATRPGSGQRVVGIGETRLRGVLLAAQIAIGVILLVGAVLLMRAVQHAGGTGLGFDIRRIAAIKPFVPPDAYSPVEREQLGKVILDAAAEANLGPMGGTKATHFVVFWGSYEVRLPDEDKARPGTIVAHEVTPGYFEIMSIPLITGRLFDAGSSLEDVVVNQTFARSFWPDQPALGRTFLDGEDENRVIGVVGDVRTEHVYAQWPIYYRRAGPFWSVFVRNEPAVVGRMLDVIRTLIPGSSPEVVDLSAGVREQLQPSIIGARVAVVVALLALLIAAVGTLGAFSYVVSERTREIGVRLALGARSRDILNLLTSRITWPLAGGLLVGLAGAQALGAILGNRLYGLSPRDPATYAVVLLVLASAAVLATWLPARRALRVDPAVTLRAE